MCKNTVLTLSAALLGAGVGIVVSLIINHLFVSLLLAAALIGGGIAVRNLH